MYDIRHSAECGEWYTPPDELEPVRATLGTIDLDPCGSAQSNRVVQARVCWGAGDNSLSRPWHLGPEFCTTAYVNPPGQCVRGEDGKFSCGNMKRCSCGLPREFMYKSILEAHAGMAVVYLAYNIGQLRQLSKIQMPPTVRVSIAIPPARIPYLNPETLEPVRGTNADSAFVLFTRAKAVHVHDAFAIAFRGTGCEVYSRHQVQACL